jgi:tRNA pseudouridine38-40 synthase
MARFKVYLEYEGTRYSGWQVQKNARTVQGELLEAAQKIFNTHQLEFYGAGRTDAGVHALRQVAHLDVATMLAPEIIRMKLNDELPADINLLEVEKAPKDFHARHDAEARSYVYQISRRRTAFAKRYVWWVKDRLDIAKIEAAAKCFVGMKNFESFTADDPDEKSTKVLIDAIQVKPAGELILIRISGSHFLWKMVRQMVGILAEVGRGNMAPAQVAGLLTTKSEIPAKYTAPPSGLFLERVYYSGDPRDTPLRPVMDVDRGV